MTINLRNKTKYKLLDYSSKGPDPFYLYDSQLIRNNCHHLMQIPYQNKSIHFAAMANSHPLFLTLIKKEGLNIFVNSTEHLSLAQKLGFRNKQIIFAASAMSITSMQQIKKANAVAILDSTSQLKIWLNLFPAAKVGIRCNIGGIVKAKKTRGGYFIGKDSRLGLNLREIKPLYGTNKINGLHVYVGTDILDIDYFISCYKAILAISQKFPSLEYIDFGGGFGIAEETGNKFNFKKYGERITTIMQNYSSRLSRPLKLILEPGRIIGAEAGYFICRVNDVKYRNGRQLIGVNASSVQFPRPLFYPDEVRHPIKIITKNKKTKQFMSDIYGCSTYSRDFLGKGYFCPEATIGDLVIFFNAGAYCASSYTNFLGFKQPKEYFYEN